MADNNAAELERREKRLFDAKKNFDSLNQELAYNFYPERADFTTQRWLGTEFAVDLFDSAPVLCRRDLGNARAAMLRPRGSEWFLPVTGNEKVDKLGPVRAALKQFASRARAAMYQARSGYVRAQKEADHDIVTFGNGVQTVEATRDANNKPRMLNRCWHLRDCAWLDDADGVVQDYIARRFKASARHIRQKFPEATLHDDAKQALDKEPDREFNLCHVMMLADEYEYAGKGEGRANARYASVYYDSDHRTLLRERPSHRFRYVVQRWATVSGFQYGLSPAAIASLSDARGIQTYARVLIEASEKILDPPLKATQRAVKSAIDTSAGAINWVDRDYDERLGPSIEPLLPSDINPSVGIDLIMRTTQALKDAWYLTKLTLPQQAKTAYETAQLVEEFIRANIPLFEPWEADTELVLSEVFAVLMDINWFGDMADWPPELSSADLDFQFSNPLQDAIERNKTNQATTILGLLGGTVQVPPNAPGARRIDLDEMIAGAARGTGAPAEWLIDKDQAAAAAQAQAQKQSIVEGLQGAGQAADVVNSGLDAAQKLRDLSLTPNVSGEGAYGPS